MLMTLIAAVGVYLALGVLYALVSGTAAWRDWLFQLGIAADQLLNVLCSPLQAGAWADETMSSRAYRMDRDGRPWGRLLRPVIDVLFAWQRAEGGHCRRAYERERIRMHLPPELRS